MKQTRSAAKLLDRQANAVVDQLLRVGDVANRLGVSTRQVWKLCSSVRLPAPVRLGRSVRWKSSCIQRFLEVDCDMAAYNAERQAVRG